MLSLFASSRTLSSLRSLGVLSRAFVRDYSDIVGINQVRVGDFIRRNGRLIQVDSTAHVKPNQNAAFVMLEGRDMKTMARFNDRIKSNEQVEKVSFDLRSCTFSHRQGSTVVVTDDDEEEDIEVPVKLFGDAIDLLEEGSDLKVYLDDDDTPISIKLPPKVELTVEEVDPLTKVATTDKRVSFVGCTLSTGKRVQVPVFVKAGEKIVVDTATGLYNSRAKN
eukprot:GILI01026565.1.p1 GENE.GILI01026565.1~~GILI01026565.1.p1  ORF type:complete len:236 (-),score=63.40 GILI01026565.1:66-728(-)